MSIKVTDNRMFTEDGELREEFRHLEAGGAAEGAESDSDVESTPPPRPPEPEAPQRGPSPPESRGPEPDSQFLDLVAVLAEPVALFLGDAQLPDGRTTQDLDRARFYLDLLEILRRKTEGNLDPQEAAVLEDLIYRLRLRYVEKKKG